MKKIVSIVLVTILLCACCIFTGCGMDPYSLGEWFLTSYTDEDGTVYNLGYDKIAQTQIYSDDITIRYFKNKTFVLKEFDNEYTGTYSYEKSSNKTSISLKFSDGTKGKGSCAKDALGGSRYEGSLEAFGKTYKFSSEWAEKYMIEERDSTPYQKVGGYIQQMLALGLLEQGFEDIYLCRGRVELRGEAFWFVPYTILEFDEQNLSKAKRLYTYEVAVGASTSVERGGNILREGDCFINYQSEREVLNTGDIVRYYDYAVWYFTAPDLPA